jgi:hypothetical protein
MLTSSNLGREAFAALQPSLKDLPDGEILEINFNEVITFSPLRGDEYLTPLQQRFCQLKEFTRGPNRDLLSQFFKTGKLPVRETEFLFDTLLTRPYVRIVDRKCIEIYFSDSREYENALSKDQEFGNDIIFTTDKKDYAISFSTKLLREQDIETFNSANANRKEILEID